MKKFVYIKKFFYILAFIFISLFFTTSAKAFCYNGHYEVSNVWESGGTVYGYSSTQLDYCAGIYYDPAVSSVFAENATLLGHGYSEGVGDWIPATVSYNYGFPATGRTYTAFGDHYLIGYYQVYVDYWGGGWYWYDPWMYGFGEIGGGYEIGPSYYGWGYSYYWVSEYIYVGTTSASLTYFGQTRCPVGQQFTPTGANCNDSPPPPPPTLRIKDKNGNYIEGTTQNAMVGAPTLLTAELTPNDANTTISWSFGNNNENDIDASTRSANITWLEENNYTVTATASRNGVTQATAQMTMSILKPSLNSLTAQESIPNILPTGQCEDSRFLVLGCKKKYRLGNIADAGIEINTLVTRPSNDISSPTINSPQIKFVQLISPYDKRLESSNLGTKELCRTKRTTQTNTESGWVLDSDFESVDAYGGASPVNIRGDYFTIGNFANGDAKALMNDFPGEELTPSNSRLILNEISKDAVFETYVVYFFKSKNGNLIQRVLGVLKWSWKGKAEYNLNINDFVLNPLFTQPVAPTPITGDNISSIRQYLGISGNLKIYKDCSSPTIQFDSSLLDASIPNNFTTEEEFDATIVMRNTGNESWIPNSTALNVKIGNQIVLFPTNTVVTPGQTVTFTVPLVAPTSVGTYNVQAQMKHTPSGTLFGAIATQSITVNQGTSSCNLNSNNIRSCSQSDGYFDPSTCSCSNYFNY